MLHDTHKKECYSSLYCFNPFCVIVGWLCREKCQTNQSQEEEIMAKLNELATTLAALDAQLGKAKDEIIAKIAELQAALTDVELPADAQAALDSLTAKVQALDDVVPDAAPVV